MSAEAISPAPVATTQPFGGLIRLFIEKNYFYLISAVLLILGVLLKMHSAHMPGEMFGKVLKSLLILQGYEALLIVTSVLIVWRLKRLDDALTLFLIALVLFFDPTFFSDNFATMMRTDDPPLSASVVNVGCLILVPLKIYLLQAFLKLQISPRAMVAMVFAAGYIYALEISIGLDENPREGSYTYFAFSWAPLLIAVMIPAIHSSASIAGDARWSTTAQQDRLRFLVTTIPFAAVVIHFIQSSWAQEVPFYAVYLVPMVLAGGAYLLNNSGREDAGSNRLILLDIICALALVMSLPIFNTKTSKISEAVYGPSLERLSGPLPIVLTALAVSAFYVWYALRTRRWIALVRIGALLIGGGAWAFFQTGAASTAAAHGSEFLSTAGWWLWDNSPILAGAIWLLLSIAAFARGGALLVLLAGVWTIFWGFSLPSGPIVDWFPQVIQLLLLFTAAVIHRYAKLEEWRTIRLFFVFLALTVGVAHWLAQPTALSLSTIIIEGLGLFVAGLLVKEHGYTAMGGLSLLIVCLRGGWQWYSEISPAALALALALLVFGAGIAVTFMRERILARMPDAPSLGITAQEAGLMVNAESEDSAKS